MNREEKEKEESRGRKRDQKQRKMPFQSPKNTNQSRISTEESARRFLLLSGSKMRRKLSIKMNFFTEKKHKNICLALGYIDLAKHNCDRVSNE